MEKAALNSLPEFLIGQAQDQYAMTGCTAIIAPQGGSMRHRYPKGISRHP